MCSITDLNNCAVDTLKTVNPGDQITYVFKVKNDSQFAARNVEIRDLLPEHVYPVSNRYLTNGNRYLFSETIALIPPGKTKTIKFFATVNDSLPSALFKLANTATLHSPNDLDLSNNTSSDSIYVIGGKPPNIEPIAIVPNLPPVVTFVSITGDSKVGQVLKIENVVIRDPEGDPLGKARLRWLRDGQPIEGAESTTYQVQSRDEGKMIALEVTPVASRGNSPGTPVMSNVIAIAIVKRPEISKLPKITYVKIEDHVDHQTFKRFLKGTYHFDKNAYPNLKPAFQWYRDDKPLVDATKESYNWNKRCDEGKLIKFEVKLKSENRILKNSAASDSIKIETRTRNQRDTPRNRRECK